MSLQYDLYLEQHKNNVTKGFEWIREHLPELLVPMKGVDYEHQICYEHDDSKTKTDEYDAYDAYFYGGNVSYAVKQEFNRAWLAHIHRNPHHWQYYVLTCDEPEEGEILIEIPYNYLIELICDWWSFSWKTGNLYEIFDYYEKRKDYIKMNDRSRAELEKLLGLIRAKVDEVGTGEVK